MKNPFDLLAAAEQSAAQSSAYLAELQALPLEGDVLVRIQAALQQSTKVRQHVREQKVRLLRILLSLGVLLPKKIYNQDDATIPGLHTYEIRTADQVIVALRPGLAFLYAKSKDLRGPYTPEEFVIRSEDEELYWEAFCEAITDRLEGHFRENAPAQAAMVSQIVGLSDRVQAFVVASV